MPRRGSKAPRRPTIEVVDLDWQHLLTTGPVRSGGACCQALPTTGWRADDDSANQATKSMTRPDLAADSWSAAGRRGAPSPTRTCGHWMGGAATFPSFAVWSGWGDVMGAGFGGTWSDMEPGPGGFHRDHFASDHDYGNRVTLHEQMQHEDWERGLSSRPMSESKAPVPPWTGLPVAMRLSRSWSAG